MLAVRPSALFHVGLAHVDQDRLVDVPILRCIGMDPAAERRVSAFLYGLRIEDGRGGSAPQIHIL